MLLDRICLDCGHPVSFHSSQGCAVENDDLSIAAPGTSCGCTAWEVISGERAVELIAETNRNAQRQPRFIHEPESYKGKPLKEWTEEDYAKFDAARLEALAPQS